MARTTKTPAQTPAAVAETPATAALVALAQIVYARQAYDEAVADMVRTLRETADRMEQEQARAIAQGDAIANAGEINHLGLGLLSNLRLSRAQRHAADLALCRVHLEYRLAALTPQQRAWYDEQAARFTA